MSSKSKRCHKWALDFNPKTVSPAALGIIKNVCSELAVPSGLSEKTVATQQAKADVAQTENLLVKKSWDISLGPLKQVPMNLFIMWMAGNTISIFPIMMVGMMFFRTVSALFGAQQVFVQIQGRMAPLQKFMYIVGNLACLALAVYKCQVMGLLPTTASDWLAFEEPQRRMEFSGGGMSL